MISFIAASDLRCPYFRNDDSHISVSDISKLDALCDAASERCRFIVDLGDSLDGMADRNKSEALFRDIFYMYDRAASVHSVMGERDSVLTKETFMKLNEYAMRYRALDVSDYRCIFLDTYVDGSGSVFPSFEVDDEQFAWLSRLLGKSHRPAIVFSHAPLAVSDPSKEKHLVRNSQRLRELIENSGKVVLVLSGHMDTPDLVVSSGVPYITLSPMFKAEEATFAKIHVSSKGVEVIGFGAQESYSIANISNKNETGLLSKIKAFFKRYN